VLFVAAAAEDYGADRMLLQSVTALAPDHRVTVVVPARGPLQARLEGVGADVLVHRDYAVRRKYLVPTRVPGLAWRNLTSLVRLVAFHRRHPVDLVITNTEAVVVGGVVAWLIGRPHLWHVHEILVDPPVLARTMARLVHRTSDHVIACSIAVRENLVAQRPELASRTTVVPNGIPFPDHPESSPQAVDVVRVGCVGRIQPRKGQGQLADAWVRVSARLRPGHPKVELHFFGDTLEGQEHLMGDLRTRLERGGCADDVHFHGFVGDPDAVYPGLDIVVMPSVEPEAFPLVCIEAQAYGLPVIGPDRGGPAEIVVDGETGLLVDPTDADALATAIVRLAGDADERVRFGAAGRRRAEVSFSLGRYQDEVRRLVSASLAGSSSPAPSSFGARRSITAPDTVP
jgi:glycosyltransferase involved in cell wall biosynthesis